MFNRLIYILLSLAAPSSLQADFWSNIRDALNESVAKPVAKTWQETIQKPVEQTVIQPIEKEIIKPVEKALNDPIRAIIQALSAEQQQSLKNYGTLLIEGGAQLTMAPIELDKAYQKMTTIPKEMNAALTESIAPAIASVKKTQNKVAQEKISIQRQKDADTFGLKDTYQTVLDGLDDLEAALKKLAQFDNKENCLQGTLCALQTSAQSAQTSMTTALPQIEYEIAQATTIINEAKPCIYCGGSCSLPVRMEYLGRFIQEKSRD